MNEVIASFVMKNKTWFLWIGLLWVSIQTCVSAQHLSETTLSRIPSDLRAWKDWALWNDKDLNSPVSYQDGLKPLRVWPTQLSIEANPSGANFALSVEVYADTWVHLPGKEGLVPQRVKLNQAALPVLMKNGYPSVYLPAGKHQLQGEFSWPYMPNVIAISPHSGIIVLKVNNELVTNPVLNQQGELQLAHGTIQTGQAAPGATVLQQQDFIEVKSYALLEDGLPMNLQVDLELVVSGKIREETLGAVLPEGWKLSSVKSDLPVAIDGMKLKTHARPGRWWIRLSAFRMDQPKDIGYVAEKIAVKQQLIAFAAKPQFRTLELSGLPMVDVSQTKFPEKWRSFPVYEWNTDSRFALVEKEKGAAKEAPQGLTINRQLWLDQDGKAFTFHDQIHGQLQGVWRLDAVKGQEMGSAKVNGEAQLITYNPNTRDLGIETRVANLNAAVTGRLPRGAQLHATGWQTDVNGVNVEVNLPPGWRLFALFGADRVSGDWLTAWSLLDLFLWMVFALVVFKLMGVWPALLAALAFGLNYHELGAPRYTWLFLLMFLALVKVVPPSWARKWLQFGKWAIVAVLLIKMIPYVERQIKYALYPQLENLSGMTSSGVRSYVGDIGAVPAEIAMDASGDPFGGETAIGDTMALRKPSSPSSKHTKWAEQKQVLNMKYDSSAKIQTGPGLPQWSWNQISYGWNGPVSREQTVRPILISMPMGRLLCVARTLLLVSLLGVLLGFLKVPKSLFRGRALASCLMFGLLFFGANTAMGAEIPSDATLQTLRNRLLQPSEAFPNAANVVKSELSLQGQKLTVLSEIHVAARCAVPLPGQLPSWSPTTVKVNGKPEATLRRDDGYLWVLLEPGIHQVMTEGLLSLGSDWQWVTKLTPHQMTVNAPGYQVNGLSPSGKPESKLHFTKMALDKKETPEVAPMRYDSPTLSHVFGVERSIELGLVWQVKTTVRRLSPVGSFASIKVPLLANERVLVRSESVVGNEMEVRMDQNETQFSWQSELPIQPEFTLFTRESDEWVEKWSLATSSVWNVSIDGAAPMFEEGSAELMPVWRPWRGESVKLKISRPEALQGPTVTVDSLSHELEMGSRQTKARVNLNIRSSMGEDFHIHLPQQAELSELMSNGQQIPIRRDGDRLIVPLKPGSQQVVLDWKTQRDLGMITRLEKLSLPTESANVQSQIKISEDRWVLWVHGPLMGPAIRFWGLLMFSLLVAVVLGFVKSSPLKIHEWLLLAIGLTQIHLAMALLIVVWLFVLAYRGQWQPQRMKRWVFNLAQLLIIVLTLIALGAFISVVAEGLLGNPEMFISGNHSTSSLLHWYEPRCGAELPQPFAVTISIWWYRFFMLLWALWLATALIRWLTWGWQQFGKKGYFMRKPTIQTPPEIP